MKPALILLVAAAIGSAPASAAPTSLRAAKGEIAPALSLRDLQGKEHRLTDHRGKVVLVNFWATWCEPCRDEMPSLQRLHRRLAALPFVILAVDVGEGEAQVRDFAARLGIGFTVLLDRDASASKTWRARVLPATMIIDRDQRVRYTAVGEVDWDDPASEAAIRKLLPSRQ